MAVLYNATLRASRMQAVLDAIDNNASAATLEICSASYAAVLASIPLTKPSFSRSGDVLTLLNTPRSDTSADATGTAAIARIKDGGGTIIVQGLTVGTSGADINLNSVGLDAGEQVTISSGTLTHAAGF